MNKKTMWLVFNTLFISFLIIMGIQIIQVNLKKRQLEKEIAETQLKINEENKKKDQIKNDMKKLDKGKTDYTKLLKYFKRKLVDYGAIREIKNSYKSEGKYIKVKEVV